MLLSAVDFFTVSNLDDEDNQRFVLNCINDPVGTFLDSIEILRSHMLKVSNVFTRAALAQVAITQS